MGVKPKFISVERTYMVRKPYGVERHGDFICQCGVKFSCKLAHIKSGNTSSCGCYNKQPDAHAGIKHGYAKGPKRNTYAIWAGMKDRCLNLNNPRYSSYGGRGITVCERWIKFEGFLEDMGEKPQGRSLDRVDNNRGYSKENCRWATPIEQQCNTRFNKRIEFNGEKLTLSQWSRRLGSTNDWFVGNRLKLGWTPEEAVSTPIRKEFIKKEYRK